VTVDRGEGIVDAGGAAAVIGGGDVVVALRRAVVAGAPLTVVADVADAAVVVDEAGVDVVVSSTVVDVDNVVDVAEPSAPSVVVCLGRNARTAAINTTTATSATPARTGGRRHIVDGSVVDSSSTSRSWSSVDMQGLDQLQRRRFHLQEFDASPGQPSFHVVEHAPANAVMAARTDGT
jgi:hypothetical protein